MRKKTEKKSLSCVKGREQSDYILVCTKLVSTRLLLFALTWTLAQIWWKTEQTGRGGIHIIGGLTVIDLSLWHRGAGLCLQSVVTQVIRSLEFVFYFLITKHKKELTRTTHDFSCTFIQPILQYLSLLVIVKKHTTKCDLCFFTHHQSVQGGI